MKDFERALQEALQRREPPHDLTAPVMSRIEAGFRWRPLAAIAAAVILIAAGLQQYQQYRRGQEAKQQVMLALEITAQKLAMAQEKVNELSQRRIGDVQ